VKEHVNWKKKHKIALCEELALEEAMDLRMGEVTEMEWNQAATGSNTPWEFETFMLHVMLRTPYSSVSMTTTEEVLLQGKMRFLSFFKWPKRL
jgi:hypothetical protein